MIQALSTQDMDAACEIVNKNWRKFYSSYVNPRLTDQKGCRERTARLKRDFIQGKRAAYVWKEREQVLALLSVGETTDSDKPDAFEIWRLYIEPAAQNKGIGTEMLTFAEQYAKEHGYGEIIIWTFKQNQRALSLYQKLGYSPDKEEYLGKQYKAYGIRLTKKI